MSSSKKMKEIVARVKKRRKELNLSYEDLSKRTGFGKSTLQRYETGSISNMPIDRFELLAKGLEIEPYKLMGWDEDYLLSQDKKNKADADIVDLHKSYLMLNDIGKRKVLEYIFDILSIEKYVQAQTSINADTDTDSDMNQDSSNSSKDSSNDINLSNSKDSLSDMNSHHSKRSLDNITSLNDANISSANYPQQEMTSLTEMFTTVAAHNDGLEKTIEQEMDSLFIEEILKLQNKNNIK